jgi:ABC-type phosphate transport system auxiliary subunit
MGAFSSIIVAWIADCHGFIWAFSSAVVFMAVFLFGLIVVIDEKGIVPAKEEPVELG